MKTRGRRKRQQMPLDRFWEAAFEAEVRSSPVKARADELAWIRTWRRQPGRVFWMVNELGERKEIQL